MMQSTSIYFNNVNTIDLTLIDISKDDFTKRERIFISSLIANQIEVNPETIEIKRKGKQLTTPYVLRYQSKLILIDGHHTVIAKKLNGNKYCYVLTHTIK